MTEFIRRSVVACAWVIYFITVFATINRIGQNTETFAHWCLSVFTTINWFFIVKGYSK